MLGTFEIERKRLGAKIKPVDGESGCELPLKTLLHTCEELTRLNMKDLYDNIKWENAYSEVLGYCSKSKLRELEEDGILIVYCSAPGELKGFIKFFQIDSRHTFVMELQIAESLRGQGIGTHLMNEAANYSQSKWNTKGFQLCVQSNNDNAMKFYEKLGFKMMEQLPSCNIYEKYF